MGGVGVDVHGDESPRCDQYLQAGPVAFGLYKKKKKKKKPK
jgi:hypothetical protein